MKTETRGRKRKKERGLLRHWWFWGEKQKKRMQAVGRGGGVWWRRDKGGRIERERIVLSFDFIRPSFSRCFFALPLRLDAVLIVSIENETRSKEKKQNIHRWSPCSKHREIARRADKKRQAWRENSSRNLSFYRSLYKHQAYLCIQVPECMRTGSLSIYYLVTSCVIDIFR